GGSPLPGSGEEHQVVSQDAPVTFAFPRGLGLAAQRRAQQPLVPREGALRLPALPVDPAVTALPRSAAETSLHLPPIARLRPFPPLVAAVWRDHGRADAEDLAAQAMGFLPVGGSGGPEPAPRHPPPGLR